MRKNKKIFVRERHYCPYSKNTMCSGWGCGEDCMFHPDFTDEPDCNDCHFNKKNRSFEKKKLRFQEYWEADDKPCIMKKIPEGVNPERFAMSNTKTEELPECPYAEDLVCECIEQGLCDRSCRYHPYYEEYEDGEDFENHPCERVRNFMKGIGPCVDCDKEFCPVPDDYDTPMVSMQEAARNAEDHYLMGYKDGFLQEEPMVEDDEIRDMLEQLDF